MAQSYLESMLSEHEKILYATRQHWFLLISSILFEIILILIFLAAIVTVAVLEPQFAMLSVAIGFAINLNPDSNDDSRYPAMVKSSIHHHQPACDPDRRSL